MKKLIMIISVSLLVCSSSTGKPIGQKNTQAAMASVSTEKSYADVASPTPIPASWLGKYTAYFSYGDVAGQAAGWELEINITKDKITAKGKGFQMAFMDELKANVSGSKLVLTHLKNVSGYTTGKKMNPEFTLVKNQGNFYVKSEWIAGGDVKEKPTALGYKIDKAKK
ncbi:MAG: hypothetical protein V4687_14375 [Bacteroidota bacterium]